MADYDKLIVQIMNELIECQAINDITSIGVTYTKRSGDMKLLFAYTLQTKFSLVAGTTLLQKSVLDKITTSIGGTDA